MAVHANFTKARNVTGLWYPDDSDKSYGDFLAFLDSLHIPCCCSPIHDKDAFTKLDVANWIDAHTDKSTGKISEDAIKNGLPVEGQKKKKHVHYMISAPGPQTPAWFAKIMSPFMDVNYLQGVNSTYSMMRYFAHLDSPEKHQYSPLGIHGFGGIDMSPLMAKDKVTSIHNLLEVMDVVRRENIRHYSTLVNWALSTGDFDCICLVTGRASYFSAYFRGLAEEAAERKALKEKN